MDEDLVYRSEGGKELSNTTALTCHGQFFNCPAKLRNMSRANLSGVRAQPEWRTVVRMEGGRSTMTTDSSLSVLLGNAHVELPRNGLPHIVTVDGARRKS